MKIATQRLEFLLLRENTRTEAENANEHAPDASVFKRDAGMKIATHQFISFPLWELKTHEPKWETQTNIRKRTKKR